MGIRRCLSSSNAYGATCVVRLIRASHAARLLNGITSRRVRVEPPTARSSIGQQRRDALSIGRRETHTPRRIQISNTFAKHGVERERDPDPGETVAAVADARFGERKQIRCVQTDGRVTMTED